MPWTVAFHEDFEPEFDNLSEEVQDELLAEAKFVRKISDRKLDARTLTN